MLGFEASVETKLHFPLGPADGAAFWLPERGWASDLQINCCGKRERWRGLTVRDAHRLPREARASGRRRRPGWEFGVSGLLTLVGSCSLAPHTSWHLQACHRRLGSLHGVCWANLS